MARYDARTSRATQQHEMDDTPVAPPIGAVTPTQVVGAAKGALVGGLAGGAVGAIVGWVVDVRQLSEGAEIGVFALVGAMALSASGAVFGGGHEPDAAGETPPPEEEGGPTTRS